ncbi:MAG: 50S ribosomal protein L29 [Acidimicrobiales bacterium]
MASKTEEFRMMEIEELENRLNDTRQELFNLRFQLVTGALDNTARIGQVRRQIARIETVLRAREIEAAEAADAAEAAEATEERV